MSYILWDGEAKVWVILVKNKVKISLCSYDKSVISEETEQVGTGVTSI